MFFKCSVWIIILIKILCADCHSGWFVDNGVSQTVLEEYLPRADTQELQHIILDLLGLPNQPKMDRFPSAIRFVNLLFFIAQSIEQLIMKFVQFYFRKSVPKFLLRIYKQLSEKDEELYDENPGEDGMYLKPRRRRSIEDNDGITDENARIIEESDFIMTFLNNRKLR